MDEVTKCPKCGFTAVSSQFAAAGGCPRLACDWEPNQPHPGKGKMKDWRK